MAFKLLNTQDVKNITKGTLGTDFDTLFEKRIIPAIGNLIAHKLGWIDFDQKARTIFITTHERQKTISLPFANILTSPTPQVWQDTATPRAYGSETLLTFDEDYTVNKRHGWLNHRLQFAEGEKVIKATITAGYLKSDGVGVAGSEDLLLGATFGADMIFRRRNDIGLTSRSLEGGSMAFMAPILRSKDFWDFFANYHLFPDVYDT